MEATPETAEERVFRETTGLPIEKVMTLYQRATQNDWKTIQTTAQQILSKYTTSRSSGVEASELAKLARSILKAENGHHLRDSGLAD
jgi:hypothetical protein